MPSTSTIELDFFDIIGTRSGMTGQFICQLEQPIAMVDGIIVAEPRSAAIASGEGTIELAVSAQYGIFYAGVFRGLNNKPIWKGRFQVTEADTKLSILIARAPIESDLDASAQAVIDRLLVDADFLALLASLGGGGGGTESPSFIAPITQDSLSVASIAVINHNFGRLPTTVSVIRPNGTIVIPDNVTHTTTASSIALQSFAPISGIWIITLEA